MFYSFRVFLCIYPSLLIIRTIRKRLTVKYDQQSMSLTAKNISICPFFRGIHCTDMIHLYRNKSSLSTCLLDHCTGSGPTKKILYNSRSLQFSWYLYQMVTQNMLRTNEGKLVCSGEKIRFVISLDLKKT